MDFFYLADVLDTIKFAAGGIMAVIVIAFVFFSINSDDFCYGCEEEDRLLKIKIVKKFLWAFFLALVITIICPSKRTSYTMLGVGTVVAYLKDNDTAKQLPDKAIIALDKWLDAYAGEEEKR